MKAKPLEALFDAMHHGKYEFRDFMCGDVSANYDRILVKGRTVYRPNKKLKAYHAFLNTFVCEYLTTNTHVVYSYRKGTKPHEAVLAHAASRAFFQADIENFFGSIDRNLVRSTLHHKSSAVPISDMRNHIERLLDLTVVDNALPIGFATSPLISNACLTDFDDELEKACLRAGMVYTRYADDLVISAQSREHLGGISLLVNELLSTYFGERLKLNPAKTKLTSIGRKVKVLGMVILPSGQVTIDMDLKKKIEVLIHFYIKDKTRFMDFIGSDMDAGVEQLAGYVNYTNSVDPRYLTKLRKKFGSTVIDSLLHRTAS